MTAFIFMYILNIQIKNLYFLGIYSVVFFGLYVFNRA